MLWLAEKEVRCGRLAGRDFVAKLMKAFISQEPPQELVCDAKKTLNINIYNKKTICISVSHRIEANISETDEGVLRTRPS